MLNKLGIISGARMARIFMDLLRESESADFPKGCLDLKHCMYVLSFSAIVSVCFKINLVIILTL